MRDVEKCEINVTLGNAQKTKCELKGSVNTKMKLEEMVNLTKVLYVTQSVNKLFIISRLASKGARWGILKTK